MEQEKTVTIPVVDGVPQVPEGMAITSVVTVHVEKRDAQGNVVPLKENS